MSQAYSPRHVQASSYPEAHIGYLLDRVLSLHHPEASVCQLPIMTIRHGMLQRTFSYVFFDLDIRGSRWYLLDDEVDKTSCT